MSEYKCKKCCFIFESEKRMPYCPCCFFEELEDITFNDDKYIGKIPIEEHHIWPRFMDNENGVGKKYALDVKQHNILHGKITKWLWEEIREEDKQKVVKNIIEKSEDYINEYT